MVVDYACMLYYIYLVSTSVAYIISVELPLFNLVLYNLPIVPILYNTVSLYVRDCHYHTIST